MGKFCRCGIPVHTNDAGSRHERVKLLFQFLRSRTEVAYATASAFWANIGHRLMCVAMMANEMSVCMENKRKPAILAAQHLTAIPTENEC